MQLACERAYPASLACRHSVRGHRRVDAPVSLPFKLTPTSQQPSPAAAPPAAGQCPRPSTAQQHTGLATAHTARDHDASTLALAGRDRTGDVRPTPGGLGVVIRYQRGHRTTLGVVRPHQLPPTGFAKQQLSFASGHGLQMASLLLQGRRRYVLPKLVDMNFVAPAPLAKRSHARAAHGLALSPSVLPAPAAAAAAAAPCESTPDAAPADTMARLLAEPRRVRDGAQKRGASVTGGERHHSGSPCLYVIPPSAAPFNEERAAGTRAAQRRGPIGLVWGIWREGQRGTRGTASTFDRPCRRRLRRAARRSTCLHAVQKVSTACLGG